jgi:hypothetical protein
MILQHLALLEGCDLPRLQRNSPHYLHVWIESAKLAFADRDVTRQRAGRIQRGCHPDPALDPPGVQCTARHTLSQVC